MTHTGTHAFGLRIPIIKSGDNLKEIVLNAMIDAVESGEYQPKEGDIIGLTESIVARSDNRYVTIDNVVEDLRSKYPDNSRIILYNPIYSRNRFAIILRAIAKYFDNVIIIQDTFDEVGNYVEHEITKVNYYDYYEGICKEEGASCEFYTRAETSPLPEFINSHGTNVLDCTLHTNNLDNIVGYFLQESIRGGLTYYKLNEICQNVSHYGLLGSNKVDEETLKLFPDDRNQEMVEELQAMIEEEFGLNHVDVMIYGDGCYKDAASGIWEFADPVVSPAYTEGLEGSPAELKLKYLADDEFKNLDGTELTEAIRQRIKEKNVRQGTMETQGTTPRKYTDLLGSLMDLISGSGDKGTPVVIVQSYFKNYAEN